MQIMNAGRICVKPGIILCWFVLVPTQQEPPSRAWLLLHCGGELFTEAQTHPMLGSDHFNFILNGPFNTVYAFLKMSH